MGVPDHVSTSKNLTQEEFLYVRGEVAARITSDYPEPSDLSLAERLMSADLIDIEPILTLFSTLKAKNERSPK